MLVASYRWFLYGGGIYNEIRADCILQVVFVGKWYLQLEIHAGCFLQVVFIRMWYLQLVSNDDCFLQVVLLWM